MAVNYSHVFQDGEVLSGAALETMKSEIAAAIVSITNSDILSSAAISTSKIDDFSATATEMRTSTNPLASTAWTETVEALPTSIAGELARLRYILEKALGGTYAHSRVNHGVLVATTGDLKWKLGSAPDVGWILMNDGTIGNAASGASNRANADTVSLFSYIYSGFSDALCPVSGGRGASAAADYAANKTIRLPLVTGRLLGVMGVPASANRVDAITGTATAGGASTLTMSANGTAPTKDNLLNGYTIETTGGTGSGQTRTISNYIASTRVITVSVAWTTVPDATTVYAIYKAVPSRTMGEVLGSDVSIPTIDTLAKHSHVLDVTPTGFPGGSGTQTFGGTPFNTDETGGGASFTNYPPAWFGALMVKL